MTRARRLCICLAASILVPAAAQGSLTPGQTCVIAGEGSMSCSVADCDFTGTLTADCSGLGDDAGGDDLLDVRGTVSCHGDILQPASVPDAGIRVTGGSFSCDVGDAGNASTELRLGPAGLDVDGTSAFALQDRWVQPSSPASFGTAPAWIAVSQVVPCPVDAATLAPADGTDRGPYEPDCVSGYGNEVLLGFEAGRAGGFIDDVLFEVVPGETLWCWGEPDPNRPVADTTSCYEITQVNLSDRFVVIDVRQGIAGTSYDWDQREISQYLLAAPVAAGDRALQVDDGQGGSAFPADFFHNARWVAFQDPGQGDDVCGDQDGSACVMGGVDQLPLELTYDAASWAARGGHDTLYVGDPRGAKGSRPQGTPVWITYGHLAGETGSFRVPVRVTSATPTTVDHGDSAVVFGPGSAIALRGGLLDALRTDITLPDDALLSWTWIRDPAGNGAGGCTTGRVLSFENSDGMMLSRVSKTGGHAGPASQACDRLHGVGCNFGTCTNFTISDVRWRHTGDDTFLAPSGPGNPLVSGYTFRRVISEYASNHSESAEMFQASGWDGGTIIDAYCGDCLSKVIAGVGMFGAGGATAPTTVRGGMAMGIQGRLGNFGSAWDAANVSLYGGDQHLSAGQGAVNGDVRNFVVDHYLATKDAVASEVARFGGTVGGGIIRRSEGRNETAVFLDEGARVSDLLVHDTKGGGAGETGHPCLAGGGSRNCSVAGVHHLDADAHASHVTVLGHDGMCGLLTLTEDTPPNLASALLLVGMSETSSSCRSLQGPELAVQEAAAGADPWCFFGSQSTSAHPDVRGDAEDDLPPGSLVGVAPLWIDAASDQYLPASGGDVAEAGCGARAGSGVFVRTWAHYLRRMGRDCLGCAPDTIPAACGNGIDDDGDGDADFPDDIGCRDLTRAREDPACSDGVDNDGDGLVDWDGAGTGAADPQCMGEPWRGTEMASGGRCGLGPGLAPVLALLLGLRPGARRRRADLRPVPEAGSRTPAGPAGPGCRARSRGAGG